MEVRTRNTSRDSSPGEQLTRTKSMNLPLQRTESDIAAFSRNKPPVLRTRSSRPSISIPTGAAAESVYHENALFRMPKSAVSKSKSVDNPASRFARDMRMSSVPIQPEENWSGLEMGCLTNYGLHQGPWPTAAAAQFSPLMPPPPSQQQQAEGNLHRRLERQLTINPSFDPRINKEAKMSPKHHAHAVLSTEAIEYMHRNPPPPLGLIGISEQSMNLADYSHQNVTRNASAPDSIRQWGSSCSGPINNSLVEPQQPPLGLGIAGPPLAHAAQIEAAASSPRSAMQRHNSTSDSQLNRGISSVNRALSSDPFSSSDTWKYNKFESGITDLLGTSSIWSAAPSPPQLVTPPPSPSRNTNLGPVGSRPGKASESRLELHYHLCRIFPNNQVEHVMKMLPDESDPKVLCAKILEMFPSK